MKKRMKISYNAPVILSFVFICLVAMLVGVLTGGRSTRLLFMTYHSSLANPLTYLRLFTHVFGHSGWSHFMGNAAYLLLLGPMLEEKYGSKIADGDHSINSTGDGNCELYILLERWPVRSKWCCICFYYAVIFYGLPGRRDSTDIHSHCHHIYWSAGV